jgi:hypothetical protein
VDGKMGFFFKDEQEERDAKQRKALRKGTAPDVTTLDTLKAVKASAYDLGATINAGERAITAGARAVSGPGSRLGESFDKAAEYREKRFTTDAEIVTQNMSPGGRAMAKGTLLPNEEGDSAFLENPVGWVGFNAAKQAPTLLSMFIPGKIVTTGVKAAMSAPKYINAVRAAKIASVSGKAGGATTITAGSLLNAGDVAHSIYTVMDNMTVEEWEKIPEYKDLVKNGMKSGDAIEKITDRAVASTLPILAIIGPVLNKFDVMQTALKASAGTLVKKGLIKGTAQGAAKEAGQEFLEEGSGALIAQDATRFGKDFDWDAAAEQALSGAVVGGVIGGGVGAVSNIGKKKIPVVPAKAPDPAQTAATTGAPLPPVPPTKSPPPASSVGATPPVGPPVVAVGPHTPPPGAQRPKKDMKKKKTTPGVPVVEASVIPDAAQKLAIQGTAPLPPVQAPPEVQAPVPAPAPVVPQVTQSVTPPVAPEPIIRRQAQQAPPPVQEVAPPLEPPAPVAPAPVTPLPVEQVPPGSVAARIYPDLQAKAEFERQINAPSQGTRYELGLDPAEVNNPAKHQAWRRKMMSEVNDSADPLVMTGGDWRNADITVTTDEGKTATVKAGQAVDYHVKRMKAVRELLDCVNAT